MKNLTLFALAAVAAVIFTSCGGETKTEGGDSTAVDTTTMVTPAAPDSTATPDSTAAADSTK
jgi:hypothetical protein